MKKNIVPLVLFCLVFLAYSVYFVKVVHTGQLEQNSIAKTIKRALDQKVIDEKGNPVPEKLPVNPPIVAQPNLQEPIKRYVNYTWLNVRKDPSLSSPVVEKILRDEEVQVMSYPSTSWAYIKTTAGTKGYVASRYLSDQPSATKTTPTAPVAVSTPVTIVPIKSVEVPTVAKKVTTFDIPIISYYHVTDETGKYSKDLTLPIANFITQLGYISVHKFKTYTFFDLKKMSEGTMTPEKGLILAFNGGYQDAYIASQHINGMGLKAVFFIVTSKVGTPGYLDWREIKMMRSWGMEIASAGVHGANLTKSTDYYMNDEIATSKKTIEQQLGEAIITFAYPSGLYNNVVMKAVEAAGYIFARTDTNGSRYTNEQFYNLPTLRVFPTAAGKQFQAWLGE